MIKGRILLLIAIEKRQEYIVSYLLEQGADANEVSRGSDKRRFMLPAIAIILRLHNYC